MTDRLWLRVTGLNPANRIINLFIYHLIWLIFKIQAKIRALIHFWKYDVTILTEITGYRFELFYLVIQKHFKVLYFLNLLSVNFFKKLI